MQLCDECRAAVTVHVMPCVSLHVCHVHVLLCFIIAKIQDSRIVVVCSSVSNKKVYANAKSKE